MENPHVITIRKPSTGLMVIGTILLFMLSVTVFTIATIVTQSQRDAKLIAAQRQVNGDSAMIYAVCTAFHQRDLSDAHKWAAVTKIELDFKRANNNPMDAAYHSARRKMLKISAVADQKLVHFDCLTGMEKAYRKGAESTTADPSAAKWIMPSIAH